MEKNNLMCSFCTVQFNNVLEYNKHLCSHRNIHNFMFCCPSCNSTFAKFNSYISHFRRIHGKFYTTSHLSNQAGPSNSSQICNRFNRNLQCKNCDALFTEKDTLMKHLKYHISDNLEVECPLPNCGKKYTIASSLSSHISRYHNLSLFFAPVTQSNKHFDELQEEDEIVKGASGTFHSTSSTNEFLEETAIELHSDSPGESLIPNATTIIRDLSLLYLKLSGKLLVPESTIQVVADEFRNIFVDCFDDLLTKCAEIIEQYPLNSGSNILKTIQSFRNTFEQENIFRSTHMRKNIFLRNFHYIPAQIVYLDVDETDFMHYISLEESLKSLMLDKSVQNAINLKRAQQNESNSNNKIFKDFEDGEVFQTYLKNNCINDNSLSIILYQDAFEIVNPLGSAKKLHKLLAVYVSLGNLPLCHRSKVENILLLLLCKEKFVKKYGYNKVIQPCVDEIKKLQVGGIKLNDSINYNIHVAAVTGDNLGSNGIGGFVESFSGNNYCRFCLATKTDFIEDSTVIGTTRIVHTYNHHIQMIEKNSGLQNSFGVKTDSILNSLENFHVTDGLPPCLAHDIFEGVGSWDTALILRRFVCELKWFTYTDLNNLVMSFPYSESNNKPACIPVNGSNLGGHAMQNAHLIHLLPLILIDKIKDFHNPTWKLFLLLKEIIEVIVAPRISEGQTAYLQILIEGYLEQRSLLFPLHNLKPKHHFLIHYSELIRKFGPLVHLWTMRFESKHSYFKQCVRKVKNFKNLTATLTEKHQLFQSYQMSGSYLCSVPVITSSQLQCSELPNFTVVASLLQEYNLNVLNFKIAKRIAIYGTNYSCDNYLIFSSSSNKFCKIGLILYHGSNLNNIYFIVSPCDTEFNDELGVHKLKKIYDHSVLIAAINIQDYKPLFGYLHKDETYIVLKHALLD